MSTTNIILTIISSSLISALFTGAINWIIHNSNYRKDYYKKVIDKRLYSYEQINNIISELAILIQNDNNLVVHNICSSKNNYDDFIVKLAFSKNNSLWISHKLSHKLTELNVFLINNIGNKINFELSDEEIDNQYNELGILHFEQLKKFRKKLNIIIEYDLKNLYKQGTFFKNDKNLENQSYPIYNKV